MAARFLYLQRVTLGVNTTGQTRYFLSTCRKCGRIFSAFNIMSVGFIYTLHSGAGANVGEMSITNCALDAFNQPQG